MLYGRFIILSFRREPVRRFLIGFFSRLTFLNLFSNALIINQM